jgi:hypothetical protein
VNVCGTKQADADAAVSYVYDAVGIHDISSQLKLCGSFIDVL